MRIAVPVSSTKFVQNAINLLRFTLEIQLSAESPTVEDQSGSKIDRRGRMPKSRIESQTRKVKVGQVVMQRQFIDRTAVNSSAADNGDKECNLLAAEPFSNFFPRQKLLIFTPATRGEFFGAGVHFTGIISCRE